MTMILALVKSSILFVYVMSDCKLYCTNFTSADQNILDTESDIPINIRLKWLSTILWKFRFQLLIWYYARIYSSLDTRWSTRICVYYPPEMTNRLILKTKKYVNTRCLHSLKKCLLLQCNMINNASWDKNCCMPHKYQTEQNIIFTYCIFMTNLVCSIFCLLYFFLTSNYRAV